MRLYDKVIRMCGTADFIKGLNYKANKVKLIKTEDEDYYRRAYFNVTSERIDKMVEDRFYDCLQRSEYGGCLGHFMRNGYKFDY